MARSTAKQTVSEVDDVLDDVLANLKKLGKHLDDDAGDALSGAAAALTNSVADLIEDAKVRSRAIAGRAVAEAREHPAATAAIAAAAVAVIGLAIARRGRPAA